MANYPYMNYQQPQYGNMGYQMPVYTPPIQQNTQGAVMRLVTSEEEIAAAQIPFDGTTSYFVNTSNGKIYAKTFNPNTGTAPIVAYVKEDTTPVKYATLDDLNALANSLRAELKPKRKVVKIDDDE